MAHKVNIRLRLLAVLLALLGSAAVQAQVLDRKQAADLVAQGEYVRALEIYKGIYQRGANMESTYDLAQIYMRLRNHEEAENYLRAAVQYPDIPPQAYCDFGDELVLNAKYDEARQIYFTFATRGGDPNVARIRIFSCDSAASISARPPLYTIANERRLNSRYSDFCMTPASGSPFFVFTSDRPIDHKATDAEELARTLEMLQGTGSDVATLMLLRNALDPTNVPLFNTRNESDTLHGLGHSQLEGEQFGEASGRDLKKRRAQAARERKALAKALERKKRIYGATGRSYLNMYLTSIQPKAANPGNGVLGTFVWTTPMLLAPPLNMGEHTGPAGFTPDGNTMYVCFSEQLSDAEVQAGNNISHVGMMISSKNGEGGWSEPLFFPYNKRDTYSAGHPVISKDGRTLYFSSDMPGSLGGKDIWRCELLPDGQWSPAINLGATINTIRDESFPTLDLNDELYFSSDGHPGLGGLDIFKAIGKKDSWTGVENLRKPVNSSADDFSMVFVKDFVNEGLFSSNRAGGYGEDDIYSFKGVASKPEPKGKPFITVTVVNRADSSRVPGVHLTLTNLKTRRSELDTSDHTGTSFFVVAPRSFYNLYSQASGYMPSTIEGINTGKIKPGESQKLTLPIDKLSAGSSFQVKNVNYASGSAKLTKAAFKELNKVVKFMKDNPTVKIELGSHTDSKGSLAGNMRLSKQRAQGCVNYLKKRGIPAKRIVAKGYGPTRPLIKRARTAKQLAKNRRTEVKILSVE
ncbi:MAG: OmpA family protein [Prevotellaceae bacterium]|nr:OmpA family protein [Prevotellaceae bacterium]